MFRTVKGLFAGTSTLIWCLALICCVACKQKEVPPPDLLSEEEMVQLLMDVYIAEQKVNRLGISQDSASMVFEVVKKDIFSAAKTKEPIFEKSFDYYFAHPDEMERIYTAVVDSLQLREQRAALKTKK